jgi:hypothetical protein
MASDPKVIWMFPVAEDSRQLLSKTSFFLPALRFGFARHGHRGGTLAVARGDGEPFPKDSRTSCPWLVDACEACQAFDDGVLERTSMWSAVVAGIGPRAPSTATLRFVGSCWEIGP